MDLAGWVAKIPSTRSTELSVATTVEARRERLMAETTCVLVTGASSGIGRAIAVRCVADGYRVFGTSRNPGEDCQSGVEMLPLDVRDGASVERCVEEVLARAGV